MKNIKLKLFLKCLYFYILEHENMLMTKIHTYIRSSLFKDLINNIKFADKYFKVSICY